MIWLWFTGMAASGILAAYAASQVDIGSAVILACATIVFGVLFIIEEVGR